MTLNVGRVLKRTALTSLCSLYRSRLSFLVMSSERRQWNAKLFGCAEDWNTCCRVFWFPCVEHAEQGQFILERNRRVYWMDLSVYFILWFLCLEWTVGALRREDIRRKYNISAKPFEDLVTHLFCHPCASCQESRQLRIRTRNPSVRLSQPSSRGQSWSLSFNMLNDSFVSPYRE